MSGCTKHLQFHGCMQWQGGTCCELSDPAAIAATITIAALVLAKHGRFMS